MNLSSVLNHCEGKHRTTLSRQDRGFAYFENYFRGMTSTAGVSYDSESAEDNKSVKAGDEKGRQRASSEENLFLSSLPVPTVLTRRSSPRVSYFDGGIGIFERRFQFSLGRLGRTGGRKFVPGIYVSPEIPQPSPGILWSC